MQVYNIPEFIKDVNNLRAAAPNLVMVGVDWCRYCKEAKPIMDKVARALGVTVPTYYINADVNTHLAKSLGVKSYPTIFFVDRNDVYKFEGDRTVNNLIGFVCEHTSGSDSHSFCTTRA